MILPATCTLLIAIILGFEGEPPLELRLIVPEGTPGALRHSLPRKDKDADPEIVWCAKEVLMDATSVASALAKIDALKGWTITIQLTEKGKGKFTDITTKHVHERLGILSSGKLLMPPWCKNPSRAGYWKSAAPSPKKKPRIWPARSTRVPHKPPILTRR
jgi:preprotein translocase subunit SecD